MPPLNNLTSDGQQQFLRVMQESQGVERHFQLFLWLQGSLQQFLPHEILIAVVGDFANRRLKFDIVSALPTLRTATCMDCHLLPIASDLFDRWQAAGRQMMSLNDSMPDLLNASCACDSYKGTRGMHWALVHGLRDERSGEDALYIAVRARQPFDDRHRNAFALLMPQIDHACRRVVSLVAEQACPATPTTPAPAWTVENTGLSAREMEILEWVRAGKTNHEIGMILNISAFTVKNHMQRIFRKIDVVNRTQAVAKLEQFQRIG